jgi:hypothetical protein
MLEEKEKEKKEKDVDEKMKKEICMIKKIIWDNFIGEGFEVVNGMLGLE